jgi:serine/threonine protein kinase
LSVRARAISQLNHPNICTLHDIGHDNGTDFLVMEFIDGESLNARLKNGPLPADQLLRVSIEVADALDKAHRAGIVHRDLKPGNIMLTKTGAKLLDFGLAKPLAASPGASRIGSGSSATMLSGAMTISSPASPLTSAGSIVGTVQYMSPEQIHGVEADACSDIFAFGVLLFEMATGKPAFAGKTQSMVVGSILATDPPPVSSLQPSAPPALDRIVRTCLAKDPDDRYQCAAFAGHRRRACARAGGGCAHPVVPFGLDRRSRSPRERGLLRQSRATTQASRPLLHSAAGEDYVCNRWPIPWDACAFTRRRLRGVHRARRQKQVNALRSPG